MKPEFGLDCTVLYSNSDSLIYELHQYPYPAMKRNCYQRFDTSDYPPDHIWEILQVNKKVLGRMSDEYGVTPVTDDVDLRCKHTYDW